VVALEALTGLWYFVMVAIVFVVVVVVVVVVVDVYVVVYGAIVRVAVCVWWESQ
jgi:hypothetical protein